MTDPFFLSLSCIAAALLFGVTWLARFVGRRSTVRQRLSEAGLEARSPVTGGAVGNSLDDLNWLRRWLFLAGFRGEFAPLVFMAASAACALLAALVGLLFWWAGFFQMLLRGVQAIPGGVGEVFYPLAVIAPWLSMLLMGTLPIFWVRRKRFQRIERIEQDLPLVLELLATLGESGIGFDAALPRILETRLERRPLAVEFRTFQADLLAGRPRVASFRRLSRRVQVSSISIFVSALVQAEQLGMGVAQVLRRQADDLRDRRRERANAFAQSLIVKRLFPMVICFLPGLFVWTLGPFFVQLFQLVDSLTRTRGL